MGKALNKKDKFLYIFWISGKLTHIVNFASTIAY